LWYADVKKSAIDFIKAFYPRYIEFIKGDNQRLDKKAAKIHGREAASLADTIRSVRG